MTTIKTVPVPVAAAICGLNHLQQSRLEAVFAKAHRDGLPPGDLLKIVAQHVEAARAAAGNPYASKLDASKAQKIRLAHKGGAGYSELAREWGVSPQSVKRICRGQSYSPVLRAALRRAV